MRLNDVSELRAWAEAVGVDVRLASAGQDGSRVWAAHCGHMTRLVREAAPDVAALAVLRQVYGDRWRIRRTPSLWIAAATDPDTPYAPTVIQPGLAEFVRELADPPLRDGRRFSLLSAPWVRNQLEQWGDGVYSDPTPPAS